MVEPWKIINELQSDNSRLFKEGVIEKYIEDINFQEGLAMCLDPLITFGVKQVPISDKDGEGLSWEFFKQAANQLIERKKTGHAARDLIVDLNKVPNLLIGGTTGSGKSVLLHSIILSLIRRDAEIYLADPKFVEFSMYSDVRQVKWIDNTAQQLSSTLNHIKNIMQSRYDLLVKHKCRNIKEYANNINTETIMKPICIVIDEWADLVLSDRKIQEELCCIAQKGRAAGIGIVLATQRPSVNVVSGLIKANFPGRVCLRVASQVDSKVILDRKGGESLSDVGTGIYLDGNLKSPIHFKSHYIENISEML